MTLTPPALLHDGANPAPQSPLLLEWQRLTREGLAASRAHCLIHALAWYEQALQVARQLIAEPLAAKATDTPSAADADNRLAAFVIAHLNLADCYEDMEQPGCAAVCLSRVHRKLATLVQQDATCALLRLAACRHLRQTFAALHAHRARHGEHPAIATTLRECSPQLPTPGALLH